MGLFRKIGTTLEMIKWEHSIFVLPFAMTGAMLAAGGWPSAGKLLWIIVCMVSARSAAMAFNRLGRCGHRRCESEDGDAGDSGRVAEPGICGWIHAGDGGDFYHCRFAAESSDTAARAAGAGGCDGLLVHETLYALVPFVLGAGDGHCAFGGVDCGAGTLDPRILLLTAAVLFWGAGFDVLYACQDFEHDRKVGLNSIPAAIGIPAAFWVSNAMHAAALFFLVLLAKVFALGAAAWLGIAVVAGLLLYEHLIVSPRDLRRLNAAFFTMNGVIAILFFVFVATDLLWRR